MQINMKFLLDFVTCYGSCSSEIRQPPGEETRMLVVQEPRRRVGRKRGRATNGGHEWQPRLSSISEDNVVTANQRAKGIETPAAAARWRRSHKRKASSISERDRNRSLDRDRAREIPLSAMIQAFPATPFMF